MTIFRRPAVAFAVGFSILFIGAWVTFKTTAESDEAHWRLLTEWDARLSKLDAKVDKMAAGITAHAAQNSPAVHQAELADSHTRFGKISEKLDTLLTTLARHEAEQAAKEAAAEAKAAAAAAAAKKEAAATMTSPPPPPSPTRPPLMPRPNSVHMRSSSSTPLEGAAAAEPSRREKVRGAIKRAWGAYVKHALGADELESVTNQPIHWDGRNKQMVTLVDALDTLYIAGLHDEFDAAVQHLEKNFKFTPSGTVSVFETTIRLTGGLLSAYALSNRTVLLEKAIEIADALAPVYTKPLLDLNHGMPFHGYDPVKHKGVRGFGTFLAEAGSVQLENRYLSHASQNATYDNNVRSYFHKFEDDTDSDGLVGNMWDSPSPRKWGGSRGTGARSDSYYEYLLKQHLMTDESEGFGKMYTKAANGILNVLTKSFIDRTTQLKMAYTISGVPITGSNGKQYMPEQATEHLSCFVPGMIALGSRLASSEVMDQNTRDRHLTKAKELMAFCTNQYLSSPTGLTGDAFYPVVSLRADGATIGGTETIRMNYGLRPETVESLFYMHRLTHDPSHREAGWKIFQAIETHCRVCLTCEVSGYSEVADVTVREGKKVHHTGHMESFFLGETMKYLYLLFDDDSSIDLDCWVFSTEAHPFPRLSKDLPEKCRRTLPLPPA